MRDENFTPVGAVISDLMGKIKEPEPKSRFDWNGDDGANYHADYLSVERSLRLTALSGPTLHPRGVRSGRA